MKKIIYSLLILAVTNVQASVAIVQRDLYKCSDQNDYDVARFYQGGYGSGLWHVTAFCRTGILTKEFYDVLETPSNETPDIVNCQEEDPTVDQCMAEFIEKNPLQGEGQDSLPPIVHGR